MLFIGRQSARWLILPSRANRSGTGGSAWELPDVWENTAKVWTCMALMTSLCSFGMAFFWSSIAWSGLSSQILSSRFKVTSGFSPGFRAIFSLPTSCCGPAQCCHRSEMYFGTLTSQIPLVLLLRSTSLSEVFFGFSGVASDVLAIFYRFKHGIKLQGEWTSKADTDTAQYILKQDPISTFDNFFLSSCTILFFVSSSLLCSFSLFMCLFTVSNAARFKNNIFKKAKTRLSFTNKEELMRLLKCVITAQIALILILTVNFFFYFWNIKYNYSRLQIWSR